MHRTTIMLLGLGLVAGCDQLSERLGIPVAAKIEAEGQAIGGACRHAGRGLEDCYRLNPRADKPAIYSGWKEMNEYMLKNGMQSVTPTIPPDTPAAKAAPAVESVAEVAEKPSARASAGGDAKTGKNDATSHGESEKEH